VALMKMLRRDVGVRDDVLVGFPPQLEVQLVVGAGAGRVASGDAAESEEWELEASAAGIFVGGAGAGKGNGQVVEGGPLGRVIGRF
jgi:hypothetical protein